ncbi:MAG: glycoside hydrolase family 127 protein [Bacteroidales bacterium]|nr:glycoside hydrolase family 127 protein [Bacteroidales bacterium]
MKTATSLLRRGWTILCGLLALMPAYAGKGHTIVSVEPVRIETPAGTVPRLPWQVMVTCADGQKEWRQAVWTNADRQTEEEQADAARYPAGSTYRITGYVIGDQTTDNGWPLTAEITVTEAPWDVPGATPEATPLPLGDVLLEGDNRLTSNRDLATDAILSWDITKQLYNYRDTYGLSTEGYARSDGWDSPTTKLKGHGSGHYMSALAFAFAGTQDAARKAALKSRIVRMVDELRACQERTFVWSDSLGRYWEARDFAPEAELREMQGTWEAFNTYKQDYEKYGYGYLNAIPAHHPALIEMYRPYNNDQWVWAPYYAIHKQLAGLIDIACQIDDEAVAAKALLIAKDMGLWVWNRMHYRTFVQQEGSRQERQERPGNRYEMWNMYIAGEVGGMAESLSRLSEMTGDPVEKARLLEAANCFDSPAFFDPVARNIDDIRTRHANQHIPMITGALRSYRGNGQPYYYNLAVNFWNMIQGRYAYATGGVGNGEMFRQPYTQILSMNTNVMSGGRQRTTYPNPDMNETCCAYNLAKLTKDLNCYDPDDARYMDYYERVMYNQIVGSLHPEHYATTYQYAVGMNAIKPFGNETPQSSCCGGTGSENHVKYQEAAWFVSDDAIWVALYLPSTAVWRQKGVTLTQTCEWPAERSVIRIREGEGDFAMKLRIPYWAVGGVEIRLNGQPVADRFTPCSYAGIPLRHWTAGDEVEVVMPFTKHLFFGPDKMDVAATGPGESATPFPPQWVGVLMYGPLVMATPDVTAWSDADVALQADLSEIQALGLQPGDDGDIFHTLQLGLLTFRPDYSLTGHATHYLRLQVDSGRRKNASRKTDRTPLARALRTAHERLAAQDAWEALTVKVPAYAPWAPNGFARMTDAMEKAEKVYGMPKKNLLQRDIDSALSALNVAINTMRPGNLAEPEDLAALQALLNDTARRQTGQNEALREAVSYAEDVVKYVNDGSGTKDMIERATAQLQAVRRTLGMPENTSARPRTF